MILAGHEDRLREDAPYRILTQYLESGAATPSRAEDLDYDVSIGSRPTSPAPYLDPPPQSSASRAATPAYIKAEVIDEDLSIGALAGQVFDVEALDLPPPRPRPQYSGPDYFGRDRDGNQVLPWQPGQTPYWTLPTSQSAPMLPPSSLLPARQRTPLFLPDSRGPTPYTFASRDSTPQVLSTPWDFNVRSHFIIGFHFGINKTRIYSLVPRPLAAPSRGLLRSEASPPRNADASSPTRTPTISPTSR